MRRTLTAVALALSLTGRLLNADVPAGMSALSPSGGEASEAGFLTAVDGLVDQVAETFDSAVEEMGSLSFWKSLLLTTRKWSGGIFILLMAWMLLLTYLDSRHPRRPPPDIPVSVVIPCYNDAASVQTAIASVFKACPYGADLIVVNDHSSDDSLARIREMTARHAFRIVDNTENKGKARSLNEVVPLARHDFVLCLDADTCLNRNALSDMLARMRADNRLGAVSAPYRPANRGFLPLMQGVEYSMLLLTQGAHNITSAMALWGGSMMLRKAAFEDVGGFRLDAITEDVDMAFRMNRRKWRVEQSFRPVRSLVPSSLRGWIRQKLRWTSGGTQCYFRHFRVWIRNPIQLFFILSYSLLIVSSVFDCFDGVDLVGSASLIWDDTLAFWRNFANLCTAFEADALRRFGSVLLCCSLSCIYILPLIRRPRDIFRLLLVIPFSILYFPAYIIVSLFGTAIGVRSLLFPKARDVRGWNTDSGAADGTCVPSDEFRPRHTGLVSSGKEESRGARIRNERRGHSMAESGQANESGLCGRDTETR